MRYALYFTPAADHPLVTTAANWLGRDAYGRDVALCEGGEDIVHEPARYGFHATLKAPFSLAAGHTEAQLFSTFENFAAKLSAFTIPELVLGQLGPFFALVPGAGAGEAVAALAEACVREFEPFRAPLSHADIERRNPDALPERQRRYLLDWGYPYIFEEFRFHMTLTDKVPEADRPVMRTRLEEKFAEFLGKPLNVDQVALFAEPERGMPFTVIRTEKLKAEKSGEAA